jgi:predicted ABC-type transport system involved in lysophospholipase L1 biosynthesis ATPase subunit
LNEAAPLFALERACIESGPFTTDPQSASGGQRLVALVGYFSPFFRLLRGDARLASGAVRLAGRPAREALFDGEVALASFETSPLAWTAQRYLEESARLALCDRRAASERVGVELERFGLGPIAKLRLCDVAASWRRRVSLARAAVTGAKAICAEAPLVDLDRAGENVVTQALASVGEERRLLLSFPARPAGGSAREFFERADFAVVVARGVVSYAGPPVPNS